MGGPGNRDYIERMHEILRMREEQRANMRIIRQREQQALRELERVRVVQQQQPPQVAPAAIPAGFGIPQAVPEPAPFLDLVHEAHGRNIHIVQQPRLPFVAGPLINPYGVGAGHPPPPPPPAVAAVRQLRHHEIHQQIRERERQRHLTEHHRQERERERGREVAERLRRNREEVLRRQRRHAGHLRPQAAELRVERVRNAFQQRSPGGGGRQEGRQEGRPANENQQEQTGREQLRQTDRDFNFQDILDLD